jgi:hypothetical protein
MLSCLKARAREDDDEALLPRAGFTPTQIVPTESKFSVIDARPDGHGDPLIAPDDRHEEARRG